MSFVIRVFSILFIFFLGNCLAKSIPERKDFIPNTFKAHFKQSYKSSLSGKEKVTKGYIEYFFPGRVRFEVTSPDKTTFVSNPVTTWYYNAPFVDGEPGEVLIKKTGKMVISKFFDILKTGLKNNDYYQVKNLKGLYEIRFSKSVMLEIGVKKSILSFKKTNGVPLFKDVRYIDLHYKDKRVIKMTFSKIEESVMFTENRFIFNIPENTQISK